MFGSPTAVQSMFCSCSNRLQQCSQCFVHVQIACTWEDVKLLRQDMEKTSSAGTTFRTKLLQAITSLQVSTTAAITSVAFRTRFLQAVTCHQRWLRPRGRFYRGLGLHNFWSGTPVFILEILRFLLKSECSAKICYRNHILQFES